MKGYIYKIGSPNTPLFYIGSTTQNDIRKRLNSHLFYYKTFGKVASKIGSMTYKIFEFGDPFIELIEEVDINNRNELLELERKYILEANDNIVNKSSRIQTKYYNREKRRDYYSLNREKRCQYQSDYRKRLYESLLKNQVDDIIECP
jgi:hypothetical protein